MSGQTPEQELSALLFLRRRIDAQIAGLAERTGYRGRPRNTAPHGTEAAYSRHRKSGEDACSACKAGHRLYERARRQRAVGLAS